MHNINRGNKMTKRDEYKERMLYETYLDLYYAAGSNEDLIGDLQDDLKCAKKTRAKIKHHMKKAVELYEKLHGKLPAKPK